MNTHGFYAILIVLTSCVGLTTSCLHPQIGLGFEEKPAPQPKTQQTDGYMLFNPLTGEAIIVHSNKQVHNGHSQGNQGHHKGQSPTFQGHGHFQGHHQEIHLSGKKDSGDEWQHLGKEEKDREVDHPGGNIRYYDENKDLSHLSNNNGNDPTDAPTLTERGDSSESSESGERRALKHFAKEWDSGRDWSKPKKQQFPKTTTAAATAAGEVTTKRPKKGAGNKKKGRRRKAQGVGGMLDALVAGMIMEAMQGK